MSIYEDVRISSSVAESSTQGASLYEEIHQPCFAWEANAPCNCNDATGYTELDILKGEATDDYGYQELLKENAENVIVAIVSTDLQYVIPNDNQHGLYEEPKILPRNPGYADLDQNKKITDDDNYQKLIKQGNSIPAGERRELPAVG